MSLADINLEVPHNLPFHRKIKSKFLLSKTKVYLDSWYRYKNELLFKDFIFLDQEYDFINCLVIFLINKKNLICTLRKNANTFKQELGADFTPELFLKQLDTRKVSLAQAIHKSQRLLGIMLGYGERNATLFQARFDIMRAISKRKKENLPEDNELNRQLNDLESQLADFSELEEQALLPPLYFLADITDSETIQLKRQYQSDRERIEDMMKKPHFMDKVLQRLTE